MNPHQMQNAIEAIGNGGPVSYDSVYERMTRNKALLLELFTLLHESSLQEAEAAFMAAYYEAARDEITDAHQANLEIDAGLM